MKSSIKTIKLAPDDLTAIRRGTMARCCASLTPEDWLQLEQLAPRLKNALLVLAVRELLQRRGQVAQGQSRSKQRAPRAPKPHRPPVALVVYNTGGPEFTAEIYDRQTRKLVWLAGGKHFPEHDTQANVMYVAAQWVSAMERTASIAAEVES